MSFRARVVLIVAVAAVALLVATTWPGREGVALQQPIQFNHQVHVKKEPCQTCHRAFQQGPAACNPTLAICMDCHTNAVSESPEEEKLRVLEKKSGAFELDSGYPAAAPRKVFPSAPRGVWPTPL